MPRKSEDMPFTLAQLAEKLHFEPETGIFTWIVKVRKNQQIGDEAGGFKAIRVGSSGKVKQYRFITVDGWSVPAARIAWLFIHGEWPVSNVLFLDEDPTNLRPGNLKLATSSRIVIDENGRRRKVQSEEKAREYGLRRYYGIDYTEYLEMIAVQGNKCAICNERETAQINGKSRELSVDHSHSTGAIRQLLCASCNHLLGHCHENPALLRAAADYLERHSAVMMEREEA